MSRTYRAVDWDQYKMDVRKPHERIEPLERETAVVDEALAGLHEAGVLPHTSYDESRFLAHRQAVRELFEIPWTAITPRMQRLLYAINAIVRPATMIAAGVFCGNTFLSNAGAAVGPGAVYTAKVLVGIEIQPQEAARAERNVRRIDPSWLARIVAADAVAFVRDGREPIDLLYLDADGAGGRGKGVYLDILEACDERIGPGGIVLAHNSVNGGKRLEPYLAHVRNAAHFRESVNVILDGEGLEVSIR